MHSLTQPSPPPGKHFRPLASFTLASKHSHILRKLPESNVLIVHKAVSTASISPTSPPCTKTTVHVGACARATLPRLASQPPPGESTNSIVRPTLATAAMIHHRSTASATRRALRRKRSCMQPSGGCLHGARLVRATPQACLQCNNTLQPCRRIPTGRHHQAPCMLAAKATSHPAPTRKTFPTAGCEPATDPEFSLEKVQHIHIVL